MAERGMGQMSLADHLAREVVPGNEFLERVAALVDWRAIEEVLAPLRSGRMGAPAYPSLVLVKALLLQQWHGLSDPGLEAALADRLSFRWFLGVPLDQRMPDHSTIWRFREQLAKSGLAETVFAGVTDQIEAAGLVLKKGTLIDASLIPAAVNKPAPPIEPGPRAPDSRDAGQPAAEAARQASDGRPASKLVRHPRDPDAAWVNKNGRYTFGYKAHVGLDMTSRIVRRVALTAANVMETSCADALICGDERAVYADKAYDSKARRQALAARGVRNRIMRRWHWRWKPPGRWQLRRNALLIKRRAPIEPLFALLKGTYRFARARYRGLARNAAALHLAVTAMNLRRWTVLASI
ncbi:MAG TPA: IS5 family transposase [Sphingomicrobium sp.]